MYPINDISDIIQQEKKIAENHVIIFLLVKPSDKRANEYIDQFNYWHHKSGKYCSIYLIGYSYGYSDKYSDIHGDLTIENIINIFFNLSFFKNFLCFS